MESTNAPDPHTTEANPSHVLTDKKHQYLILASAAFAGFMVVLDSFIVNISIPTIAKYFNASTSEISWVTMAYLLVLTSTLLMFGKLSDRVGLKKIFLAGYIVFTIGSLLCGIATSLSMLVGARCIQGIGSAMLYATAQVVLTRFLPVNIRGWSFGIFATVCALGVTMGAPVGGIITQYLSWHWVFLVNVPFGIAAVILGYSILPKEQQQNKSDAAFDYPGALLTFIALGLLLYGISMGEEKGWTSPYILGLFAAAAIAITLFIIHENRCQDPLVDPKIFKNSSFTYSVIAQALLVMIPAGSNFLVPFYLISARGLQSDKAGLVMLMYSLVYMTFTSPFGKLADKKSPRYLALAGALTGAAACLFFALTLKGAGLIYIFAYLAAFGLAYAIFMPSSNTMVFGLAPEKVQGTVSSVLKTATNLGQSLGLVFFETIFALSLPAGMATGGINQAAVPPEVMYKAFTHAYYFGVLVCVTVAFCIWRIDESKMQTKKSTGEKHVKDVKTASEDRAQEAAG